MEGSEGVGMALIAAPEQSILPHQARDLLASISG